MLTDWFGRSLLWAQDIPLPAELKDLSKFKLYGGAAAGALLLLIVFALLLRRRKRPFDPEAGQTENLAGFPPAPGKPGKRRLLVHGQPMRLRLVVVAPVGKKPLPLEEAERLFAQILRGLGDIVGADRPRFRVWPTQSSNTGFAQAFFRRVLRPEPRGKMSRWVRVAGPVSSGATPLLLGLALMADEPTDLDELAVSGTEWLDILRIQ